MLARLIQLIIFCCFGSPVLLIAQPADFAEIAKLVASDSEAGGNFGQSVAIETPWLLIGAPGETEDVIGANSLPQAGAAYFYRQDSTSGDWQEFQKVVPQDREGGDRFGSAVAIQDSMALISSIWEDDGLPGDSTLGQAGAVYVFRLHPNGVWQQHQKLVPSDRKGYDYFGCALAMDGPYAVIGAYGRDPGGIGQAEAVTAGQAYVFERDSNETWVEAAILAVHDTALTDRFGFSVSISGTTALIGAPQEDEDTTAGGNTLVDPGAAYVFDRSMTGQWTLSQKLFAADRGWFHEEFGKTVSISGDQLAIGRPGKGGPNDDGNFILNSGAALVFARDSSGIWQESQSLFAPGRGSGDRLGRHPFSIQMDGNFILAGSAKRQIAYLFAKDSTGSFVPVHAFTASDGEEGERYATSLCLDSTTIVVAAEWESPPNPAYPSAGAVYLYLPCTPSFDLVRDSICAGESYWFAGNWVDTAGLYEEVLLDNKGCDSTTTLELWVRPPVDTSLSMTDTSLISLANEASFQWLICQDSGLTPIPGETAASLFPDSSGWYAVEITQAGGCSGTSSCREILLLSTGIPAISELEIQIFPNPTQDWIQLQLQTLQDQVQISLLDSRGKQLAEYGWFPDHPRILEIPGPPGLYLLRIQSSGGELVTKKILKY